MNGRTLSPTVVKRLSDSSPNEILIYSDGNLYLTERGERKKFLGRITKRGEVVRWDKKESLKDVFRKTNAWSLPYELFKILPEHTIISFFDGIHRYTITKEKINEYMKIHDVFLWFKTSGVERKIYIPLSEWEYTQDGNENP